MNKEVSVLQKQYIGANQLLHDSFQLGAQIIESKFKPTFIVALWRGGVPIALAVQEYLAYNGIIADHIAVRTASYSGIDNQKRSVMVYDLNYIIKTIRYEDRLLIVDDVYDTGRSVAALIEEISEKARLNTPKDIRIAVPYYKPARVEVERHPDYFIHETSAWLKYPHSLEGLTVAEIKENRPKIYSILKSYLPED